MATIRKRYWLTGVVVLALAAVAMWWLRPAPISGPWRAQLVDAETGQPLEGAVVLALWDKRSAPIRALRTLCSALACSLEFKL